MRHRPIFVFDDVLGRRPEYFFYAEMDSVLREPPLKIIPDRIHYFVEQEIASIK